MAATASHGISWALRTEWAPVVRYHSCLSHWIGTPALKMHPPCSLLLACKFQSFQVQRVAKVVLQFQSIKWRGKALPRRGWTSAVGKEYGQQKNGGKLLEDSVGAAVIRIHMTGHSLSVLPHFREPQAQGSKPVFHSPRLPTLGQWNCAA